MNILAVDLGSNEIKVAISSFDGVNIEIIKIASVKSCGIKSGKITSIEDASDAVKQAIAKAKEKLSIKIDKFVISVSNAYTESFYGNSELMLEKGAQISINDITRALENAKSTANLPKDYTAIHVLPYKFRVNNNDTVDDPLGMCASKIQLEANVIAINIDDLNNIKRILELAQISNYELVSSIYANCLYCLGKNDLENGVLIIDGGALVCDIGIYSKNSLVLSTAIPIGSMHVSKDVASLLNSNLDSADKIKTQITKYDKDAILEYTPDSTCVVERTSVEVVKKCIDMRIKESLDLIAAAVQKQIYKLFTDKQEESICAYSSVLFTGGYFKIYDISEMAYPIFGNKPIRTKIAKNKVFLDINSNDEDANKIFTNPEFTCILGLLMYANGLHTNYELALGDKIKIKHKAKDYNTIKPFANNIEKNVSENTEKKSNTADIATNKQELINEMRLEVVQKEHSDGGFFKTTWNKFIGFLEKFF
ncbi:cell division protein FtsA [Campylobacter canadensis]|uniref:cell division protein FtsA n=1 Tax=Campylobacter canadensis TaxID=449520 RepID=UPI001554BD26|nr:cell division protein FtsA [Campylobacter canadensis]MBZ7994392.1 cell division protein FtsA [Campylobacter canadensis]MBZ7996088.1 cell division protein FtsA [Campylobacter canadensis]MBZ7999724.1 cell division protein FtsA [Campylobacter canadensis]MBZ8001519.1 cell division protein FtsA [Campylobacter canadensis]